MKVKELIRILEEMDEEALVVTSSSKCTWGAYVEVKELKEETLCQNGSLYENEKDSDEPEAREKIHTVILGVNK